MATLYVAEFAAVSGTGNFVTAAAMTPPLQEQTVTISGLSAATATVFTKNTAFVRVNCDAICSVVFGATPTATAANMRLALNQTEYFGVNPGHKVAVITNS